jgi:hypothetical protein
MPDYKQGKIYKIVSDKCDGVYYGSTVQPLMERWRLHKSNFNAWKKGGRICACFKLFDEYGIDNFRIELVEDYPCDNDEQLRMKEQEYIDSNECVNENRAYRSPEVARIKRLKYVEEHKEQMFKYRQEYYHANKEKTREYLEKNKEHIHETRRNHYALNKERLNESRREKVVCECGMEVSKSALSRHRKSAFHQEYLNLTI